MDYGFDRLGFQQFGQLCAALLELEGRIGRGAWLGEADDCRSVLSGSPLAPPAVKTAVPAPVLAQCAWVRSEDVWDVDGLLDTLARTGRQLRRTTAGSEGDALAGALLARLSSLWTASRAPIAVSELEAWIALAKQLSPRPELPPVGVTWAELLPTSAPDQADRSSLERFAGWLAVAELLLNYSPVGFAHARLAFPGPAGRFIDEFMDAFEQGHVRLLPSGKDPAIRALIHIRKLLPAHAHGANNALYWLETTQPGEPPETTTWTRASGGQPGGQTSGSLDIERVLRDL